MKSRVFDASAPKPSLPTFGGRKEEMKKILWLFLAVLVTNTIAYAEQFKSFAVTGADATLAKVVFSKNYPPNLEIVLKHRKSQEMAELTKTSFNQKVIILINGEVVAEPIVKGTISGGVLEVQVKDEATAIRLAKSLMAKDKDSEPTSAGDVLKAAPEK